MNLNLMRVQNLLDSKNKLLQFLLAISGTSLSLTLLIPQAANAATFKGKTITTTDELILSKTSNILDPDPPVAGKNYTLTNSFSYSSTPGLPILKDIILEYDDTTEKVVPFTEKTVVNVSKLLRKETTYFWSKNLNNWKVDRTKDEFDYLSVKVLIQTYKVVKAPEPTTILGTVTALGIGTLLKSKSTKKLKKKLVKLS